MIAELEALKGFLIRLKNAKGKSIMNQLSTLTFEGQSINTITKDGEIFFKAEELATILGFKNPRQALSSHVDSEDVQKLDTPTNGCTQQVSFVTESGMYALIFDSTRAEAKRFKKWVTSEVLPAIRKTGKYEVGKSSKSSAKVTYFDLEGAVEFLEHRRGINKGDTYNLLHERFGIDSRDRIPAKCLPDAVEYVHRLQLYAPVDPIRLEVLPTEFWKLLATTTAYTQQYQKLHEELFSKDPKTRTRILAHIEESAADKEFADGFVFVISDEPREVISDALYYLRNNARAINSANLIAELTKQVNYC